MSWCHPHPQYLYSGDIWIYTSSRLQIALDSCSLCKHIIVPCVLFSSPTNVLKRCPDLCSATDKGRSLHTAQLSCPPSPWPLIASGAVMQPCGTASPSSGKVGKVQCQKLEGFPEGLFVFPFSMAVCQVPINSFILTYSCCFKVFSPLEVMFKNSATYEPVFYKVGKLVCLSVYRQFLVCQTFLLSSRKQFFTFSVERQMNTSHFLRHLGQIIMFVESLVG